MVFSAPNRTVLVAGTLLCGLLAAEERYYHTAFKLVSVCRFQAGICADAASVRLIEQRGLANLLSTSGASANTAGLTEVAMPFAIPVEAKGFRSI